MVCCYLSSLWSGERLTTSRWETQKHQIYNFEWLNNWHSQVQGGDSDSLGKQNYHPFYITSDPNGGYGKKIESERGELVFSCLLSAWASWPALPSQQASLSKQRHNKLFSLFQRTDSRRRKIVAHQPGLVFSVWQNEVTSAKSHSNIK